MKLKRNSTSEIAVLSDGFLWSDEFDWKPVEQNIELSVDGTPIIQEGHKKDGRPITLTAENTMAWLPRSVVSTLKDWSALAGEQFTLMFEYPHDNREFNVIFRHSDTAIEASPVMGHPSVSDGDFYNVVLRFLELKNAD